MPASSPARSLDVLVIGAGQAGLAVAYYLRRSGLSYRLVDAEAGPGGAWRHGWRSLRLFSPAQWSSIPGWLMPRGNGEYPSRGEVLAYLAAYEARYAVPVERPVRVHAVRRAPVLDGSGGAVAADDVAAGAAFVVESDRGAWHARAVVSATGSWARPVIPALPGQDAFAGRLLHSGAYEGPEPFAGARVVVVGGGNSGAQIVAELSATAAVTWATLAPPTFLPEQVDGRYLFEQATRRYQAVQAGRPVEPPRSLGDIVQVPPVRAALARGALRAVPMFERFTPSGVVWSDGRESPQDAVIWATGFRPALDHLRPLGVVDARGRVEVRGTRSIGEPRLWLVGYGDWTGFASATLIGVGRTARATVDEVVEELRVTRDA